MVSNPDDKFSRMEAQLSKAQMSMPILHRTDYLDFIVYQNKVKTLQQTIQQFPKVY